MLLINKAKILSFLLLGFLILSLLPGCAGKTPNLGVTVVPDPPKWAMTETQVPQIKVTELYARMQRQRTPDQAYVQVVFQWLAEVALRWKSAFFEEREKAVILRDWARRVKEGERT